MAASVNYIALLNEHTQKNGWSWRFELVNTGGLDHCRTFTMRVVVNDKPYPQGVGRSKKEAKQNAAKNAISLIQEEEPASSESKSYSLEHFPKLTQANYTCWLNEFSQKKRLSFKADESLKMDNNQIQYACKFVCGDKVYPVAACSGKREAKEEAAKLVFKEIHKDRQTEVPDVNRGETQQLNISDLSISLSGLTLSSTHSEGTGLDNNFIGILNNYCQKNGKTCDFKLVEKIGPPHNPEFVYKVIINKNEYPEGHGKSAKKAQQRAAKLALVALQQCDGNSQNSSSSCDSSSFNSTLESEYDSSFSSPPISQNSGGYIIFKDSSAHPTSSKKAAKSNLPNPSAETPASKSTVKSSFFLENFDSIEKIGSGGFGCVLKAKHKLEQQDYAIKIVKYTSKARREVAALAKLGHPNIVRYHTCWTEETTYFIESSESSCSSTSTSEGKFLYIMMELCEGGNLNVWIEDRYKMNPYPERTKEAAEIMTQVLDAVKYVHSMNLIHRDLKPLNIMFGKDAVVKVGDFGLVTEAEAESDEALLERTNRTGTLSYMSPEQKSKSSYDKKVDIFPLGLIYFELLWNVKTVSEKLKIWKDVRNKKLPEGFRQEFVFESKLIDQMLSASPEDRPHASDLLTKLDVFRNTTLFSDRNVEMKNRTY